MKLWRLLNLTEGELMLEDRRVLVVLAAETQIILRRWWYTSKYIFCAFYGSHCDVLLGVLMSWCLEYFEVESRR